MNERAHALQDNASQFELSAGKLKNTFWTDNLKYIIILALVFFTLIGIALYFVLRPSGDGAVYISTTGINGTSTGGA